MDDDRPKTWEKGLKKIQEQNRILAKATGLLEIVEKLEIPLEVLEDDNAALTLIEATQLAIMLDPKAKRPTRLKAARDLAIVKGLDKQSRIAEDAHRIRKIREGLRVEPEEKDVTPGRLTLQENSIKTEKK